MVLPAQSVFQETFSETKGSCFGFMVPGGENRVSVLFLIFVVRTKAKNYPKPKGSPCDFCSVL